MRTLVRDTFLLASAALALASGCTRTPTLDETRTSGLSELTSEVDADRLMAFTAGLVAAHQSDTPMDCALMDEDDPHSEGCNLTRDKARAYLREQLESLGYTVTEQVDGLYPWTTVNLVAEKRGTTRPDEVVLVGAHYDAFFAAADDNSTGVAAVLELARVLREHSFARTIRFVGFDLEELGFTGSARYVAGLSPGDDVTAALVFDSIGFRRHEPGSQRAPSGLSLPTTGDFLAVISNARSVGPADDVWLLNQRLGLTRVVSIEAPGRGESALVSDLLRSDHGPFWLADKPALFFTDTTEFRNERYHTPNDTLDTLDPAFLAEVTRLAVVSVAYWAEGAP
jgi:hypothetical protein